MAIPTFVDSNSLGNNFGSALTFSLDAGIAVDRYIRVASAAHQGAGQATGVTYGGIALAQIAALSETINQLEHTVWFLAGASVPTGVNDVVVTYSAGTRLAATAISLSAVDTASPHGDQTKNNTVTANKTLNITTTEADTLIISECSSENATFTSTPGTDQTEREDVTSLGSPAATRVNMATNTRPAVAASTFSMDHTLSGTPDDTIISASEVQGNGAAPTGPIDAISAGVPVDLISGGVPIDEIAG